MIRLCIFGTSHLAAPWSAYRAEPNAWPDLDITFVGATGRRLLEHRMDGARMVPISADLQHNMQRMTGSDTLDLDQFDAFAIIGGDVGSHMIGYVYGQVRWVGLPSMAGHDFAKPVNWTLMSEAAVDAVLSHRITHSLAACLSDILHENTGKPTLSIPAPRPSNILMSMDKHKLLAQKQAIRRGDGATLDAKYKSLATHCLTKKNARFVDQPDYTIKLHLLTRSIYMEDAIRLSVDGDIPQPEADILHGNLSYGVAVLDQINAVLTGGTG